MTKSSSLSLTLAAMFSLGCNFVLAEEIVDGAQTQSASPAQTQTSTSPQKEDVANKKTVEKDAGKPTEEPNCE